MSKILPIQSDPHFHFDDYCLDLQRIEEAEREACREAMLHNQSPARCYWEHTPDGPAEKWMREDKAEPWQFKACLVAAILLLYVWLMPWILKVLR